MPTEFLISDRKKMCLEAISEPIDLIFLFVTIKNHSLSLGGSYTFFDT